MYRITKFYAIVVKFELSIGKKEKSENFEKINKSVFPFQREQAFAWRFKNISFNLDMTHPGVSNISGVDCSQVKH